MSRSSSLLFLLPLVAACTNNSNSSRGLDSGVFPGEDGSVAADDAGGVPTGDGGVPDTFAWAHSFVTGEGSDVMAVAADSSGVVLVGQISGTATIGTTTLTAADGEGNGFVAKLDPNGNVLWAKIAGGSQSAFEAVLIDSSGNIFVSGAEYGDSPSSASGASLSFGGTTLTPNYTAGMIGGSSVGSSGSVIARLDTNGNLTWMKLAETTSEIDMGALALSGSNVVVAGALNGNAAFGPNETIPVTCTTAIKECVFFAAYDAASGTPAWGLIAPSTPQRGNAGANPHQVQVGVDGTGNIFLGIGAYFEGAGSTDDMEVVVNKYDPTGALTWNKVFMAGTSQPDLNGFVVDTMGNSYLLGAAAPGLMLGSTTIDPNGGGTFLAKLDATGNVTWAQPLDSSPAGTLGMALGSSSILTFGNGDDPNSILPDTVVPMTLGRFDFTTGMLSSSVTCGIAQARGKVVASTGASVYVAGDGASPGVFGLVQTTNGADAGNGGVFVAKLK